MAWKMQNEHDIDLIPIIYSLLIKNAHVLLLYGGGGDGR